MERKFVAIVACAENGVIGNIGEIPWHIPEDLKRFKKLTTGNTIIMGSKTLVSIGRVLPNRRNVVISSGKTKLFEDQYDIVRTIDQAIYTTKLDDKVFICGGEQVYRQFLDRDLIKRVYLTIVNGNPEGDRVFPYHDISECNGWKLVEEEEFDTHTNYIYDK